MKHVLRLLPLALLVVLALGMALPVLGQDATAEAMASQGGLTTADSGLMTYAANDCSYGGEIKSIEAVDELTVKFTLCFPDPSIPSKVAFGAMPILSSDYIMSTGGGGDLITKPIGTGPYMLDTWNLGSEIDLARYDGYWGDLAKEPTAIFRWATEAAARLVELQAGTVDVIDNVGPGDFEVVQNDPNLALFPREGANVMYLGMNNHFPPFDNVKVRQAIAYGIDKQRIVDNFYPPGSVVADQFMPTSIFGYTPEVTPFPYDQDMARQLLAEAAAEDGFTLPLEVTFSFRDVARSYIAQPAVVMQDIQAQLAEIGINATIDNQETTTYIDITNRGQLEFFLLGWGADYPDATNFLDFHFGAGSSPRFGDQYPEIVEALTQGARLATPEERYPFYVQANTLLRDLAPVVPIAHGGSGVAYRATIQGAHTSPLSGEKLFLMEDPDDDNIIFMQNAEPGGLYCGDETDGESLRVCQQIYESLAGYETGGTAVEPKLANSWDANDDLTEWTFHLHPDVTFHDGSALDANDVVLSYGMQWDAASPYHVGRSGTFTYFSAFFVAYLNAPPAE